ncbi:MAG: extracellular solute-binding protein [Candidatus Hodarchaeales archaeon]|jgi:ABC-type Fe3+ transport system substrate-binding protein
MTKTLDKVKQNKIRKISLVLLLTILIAISTTSSTEAKVESPKDIQLNILTRHSSTIWMKYQADFLASPQAAAAGVTAVTFWALSEANWITQAQTGTYDVGWGGGPTLFDGLIEAGVADEINGTDVMTEVNQIPDDVAGAPMKRYDSNGDLMWVGAAMSTFGFTINKDVLDAKGVSYPESWTQISRPEYFLQAAPLVAMGNPPDTTSNTRIYEIIIQKFGWDLGWAILSSMAANSVIKGGSTAVLTAVTSGEVGVGMTIDFYGYGAQISNPAAEYIIPSGQSIVNADPICLLKGDPAKRVGANAFVEYVLSKEGQSGWLDNDINRMPARADAFDTTQGAARPDLADAYQRTINNEGIDFNDTESSSYHGTLLYYFEAVYTEAHAEHVAAWNAIVNSWKNSGTGNTPRIHESNLSNWIVALGSPIINITYARTISDQMESSASYRSTKKAEWTTTAKTHYAKIKTAAESAAEPLDTTNPIISNVQVTDDYNVSAVVNWETDEIATSTVEYGLTTSLDQIESNEADIFASNEFPVSDHSVLLKNLVPGGEYYFKVSSKDLSGNEIVDDNSGSLYSFTLVDTAPPQISNMLTSVSNDTAVISWNTDEFSDSGVNYGLTTSLGTTVYDSTEYRSHEVTLSGLSPETQYYFEINSSDGVFFTLDDNTGSYYTFTTLSSAEVSDPIISAPSVDVTGTTTATITVSTDKPTRVTLNYGIGTPSMTETSSSLSLTHTFDLTGLTAGTEYSYFVNATDAFGNPARYPSGTGFSTFTTDAATTTTTTTERGGIPGFEFLAALVVLPILPILSRKRKRA